MCEKKICSSIVYLISSSGSFELHRSNDRLQYPVCRPKSLEVSVTKIPEPGDWSEDWFTTWKSRKDNPNNLESFAQDEKENLINDADETDSHRDNPHEGNNIVVEIGSLCPVRRLLETSTHEVSAISLSRACCPRAHSNLEVIPDRCTSGVCL